MQKEVYIDADLCKNCGGKCCKRCGCGFLPEDFERMSYNYILKKLNEGNISIVSEIHFNVDENDEFYWHPFLLLRIRNEGRGVVDLVSYKNRCSILTDNGCPLEKDQRPSLALSLVPNYGGLCEQSIEDSETRKKWAKHQKILNQLVSYLSGKSTENKITEDMEELESLMVARKISGCIEDAETTELRELIDLFNKAEYSDSWLIGPKNPKCKRKRK